MYISRYREQLHVHTQVVSLMLEASRATQLARSLSLRTELATPLDGQTITVAGSRLFSGRLKR